jgi:hypothetical protein
MLDRDPWRQGSLEHSDHCSLHRGQEMTTNGNVNSDWWFVLLLLFIAPVEVVACVGKQTYLLASTGWVPPEDGDRIQSPKRRVLNERQDGT